MKEFTITGDLKNKRKKQRQQLPKVKSVLCVVSVVFAWNSKPSAPDTLWSFSSAGLIWVAAPVTSTCQVPTLDTLSTHSQKLYYWFPHWKVLYKCRTGRWMKGLPPIPEDFSLWEKIVRIIWLEHRRRKGMHSWYLRSVCHRCRHSYWPPQHWGSPLSGGRGPRIFQLSTAAISTWGTLHSL